MSAPSHESKLMKLTARLERASEASSSFSTTHGSLIVKPEYTRSHYDRDRPTEKLPTEFVDILLFCNEAYYTVSIIRNVIDLMSDFCVKGIDWAHTNRNVQAFMRTWFAKVKGKDVSERFSNYLLRLGSNCIIPDYSQISEEVASQWRKTKGAEFKNIKVKKLRIPSSYSFIDVTALTEEIVNNDGGAPLYKLNASGGLMSSFGSYSSTLRVQSDWSIATQLYQSLPTSLKNRAIKEGGQLYLRDGEDIFINHYRKDDWDSWARPIIYAIGEPVIMLKKMHLADMSALDGVISSIRLWRIGYIDPTNVLNSIIPSPAMLTKVSDHIKKNMTGGVIDVVWGPELDFKESSSNAHHFLTQEKYYQVMSEIYEGLGINPAISGGSGGTGGGLTNNSIALKVMVERLSYIRNKLIDFWMGESRKIQKAMGFSSPAQLVFDDAIFSDEVAYKKLLVELYDRDIISTEGMREEFNLIDNIETSRIRKEYNKREKGSNPPKAGPYHDPMVQENLVRDLVKSGQLDGEEAGLEGVEKPPEKFSKNPGGRPIGAKDIGKREPKPVRPKSVANHNFVKINAWARESFDKIGELIGPIYLSEVSKANMRQLTDVEANRFEDLKLSILMGIEPMTKITNRVVALSADNPKSIGAEIVLRDSLLEEFSKEIGRIITMDDKRIAAAGAYSLSKLAQN